LRRWRARPLEQLDSEHWVGHIRDVSDELRMERRKLVVTTAMAEFARMRDEIDRRSDAQDRLVALAGTAAAAIGSVALATQESVIETAIPPSGSALEQVTLLLPVLTMALGLLWLDHDRAIRSIASDIQQRLTPLIRSQTGNHTLLGNEERVDRLRRRHIERTLLVATPYAAIFLSIPIVGFVASFEHTSGLLRLFWIVQLIGFAAYYLPLWFSWWFFTDRYRQTLSDRLDRNELRIIRRLQQAFDWPGRTLLG
jgi:hypothetical protein